MNVLLRNALFAAALAAFCPLPAFSNEVIAISAVTVNGYERPSDANGRPTPEAYVFGEGNFLGGATKDAALENYPLPELLKTLAKNLAKQHYYPASDRNDADLLIIVHWGVTMTQDDPVRDLLIDKMNDALREFNMASSAAPTEGPSSTVIRNPSAELAMADPGDMNLLSANLAGGELTRGSAIARNAALLGYTDRLRNFSESNAVAITSAERTLRDELSQERYFVVLMAYDFKAYKQKKSALRWVTRLSVRSPGNSFRDAVVLLSEAGGNVFGTKLDKLSHVRGKLRKGEVVLGELKVLGEE